MSNWLSSISVCPLPPPNPIGACSRRPRRRSRNHIREGDPSLPAKPATIAEAKVTAYEHRRARPGDPGRLRVFGERIRTRRGANIATVAVARKLAVLSWHLLTREEDYAFARPSLVREKVRLLELAAGDARRIGYRNPVRVFATPTQHRLEREVGTQAEKAYRRYVKDFKATG